MSNYTEKNKFSDIKINDCHWHISRQYPIEDTMKYIKEEMNYLNIENIVILSLEQDSKSEVDHTANLKALYLRDTSEGRVRAFASLHYYRDERDSGDEFLRQVKLYHKMGFDGIKMLEGKPNFHEWFDCKLDSEKYDKMFSYIAENEIPLVIHVADFIAFPDENNTAEREMIHTEMLNVLKKYPNLRVTFAHVFNMSYDRERLDTIFETYPNVSLDLALGGDFMINFSNDIDGWREFFIKYSDRVIFGTDTYNMYFEENDDYEIAGRHTPLHKFFESEEPFTVEYYDFFPQLYGENVVLNPAKLPEKAVKDIYYNSFIKAFGDKQKTTDKTLVLKFCDELKEGYEKGALTTAAFEPLPDWISPVEKANMARGDELALENIEVIKAYYENN